MTKKISALVEKYIYRLILMIIMIMMSPMMMTKEIANLHGGVPRGKSAEAPTRTFTKLNSCITLLLVLERWPQW